LVSGCCAGAANGVDRLGGLSPGFLLVESVLAGEAVESGLSVGFLIFLNALLGFGDYG
jgi:hypothetical protein